MEVEDGIRTTICAGRKQDRKETEKVNLYQATSICLEQHSFTIFDKVSVTTKKQAAILSSTNLHRANI